MKTLRNIFVLIPIVLLCLLAFEELAFWGPGRRLRHKIEASDTKSVLAACRQMIVAATNALPPDKLLESRFENLQSVGSSDPTFSKVVPMVLLELGPKYVTIRKDHVLVCFSALPRVYILAFADGARQFGDKQLTDGLWLFSGHYPEEEIGQPAN